MTLEPRDAEIVVGIVARIGIETPHVAQAIADSLASFGYKTCHQIKVTDALKQIALFEHIPQSPMEARYSAFIKACNDIREKTKSNDIMGKMAAIEINSLRAAECGYSPIDGLAAEAAATHRRAFILNQLKRPEEAEFLRSLYGEHYVQISCHTPVEQRAHNLADRIAHGHPERPRADAWIAKAHDLIRIDDAEEENPYGQRVRDIFPSSDVVIDASTDAKMRAQIDRFFAALFGDFRVTPTPDEYGMQLANTAALRSADLSRQVGAAILNEHHEVQALGCNEVPKAKGGTYWEGDSPDGREFYSWIR